MCDRVVAGSDPRCAKAGWSSLLLAAVVLLFHIPAAGSAGLEAALADKSVIRVSVTQQGYHFRVPWQKRPPATKTAIGAIIEGPRVLVTSELMADHRYIELEKVDSLVKSAATIEVVDYEANLALLTPTDPRFLADMEPLGLTTDAVLGDRLTVWQVQPNGNITPSMGPITSIELASYPYQNYFLSYRVNNSLQYRFGNSTLPLVKDGRLAGLLMRYDSKAQTVDVVAAPVIEHFLKDAADGDYQGFPVAATRVAYLDDPQLRRYLGVADEMGGVYVENVLKGSSAEKAGLRAGDILLEVAGFPLDNRGNYEHPLYGKVAAAHLVRCEFQVGDTVSLKLLQDGKTVTAEITLDRRPSEDYLVPPYVIDEVPRYYIMGGFILQELSAPYLKEFAEPRQAVRAPIHLIYYESNQEALDNGEREKIVFISNVIPTSYTAGYEDLSNLVIKAVNNQGIGRLEDVPRALEYPVNGFHRIEVEQYPGVIYLDPDEIPLINDEIRRRYNLPAFQNLTPYGPK